MNNIILNRIKCKKCGDIIESTSVYDMKYCSCGQCYVEGGKEYLRRGFHGNSAEESFVEMSVTEN